MVFGKQAHLQTSFGYEKFTLRSGINAENEKLFSF